MEPSLRQRRDEDAKKVVAVSSKRFLGSCKQITPRYFTYIDRRTTTTQYSYEQASIEPNLFHAFHNKTK